MSQSTPEETNEQLELTLDGLAIVGRLFWGPEPALCGQLTQGPVRQCLEQLATVLDAGAQTALQSLTSQIDLAGSAQELFDLMEPEYVSRFVSGRAPSPAPMYHSCYEGGGDLMGRPAHMMTQRLQEAGISLDQVGNEPPDHLAIEIEYFIMLTENDPQAGASFASTEMLPWLTQFSGRLAEDSTPGFYPPAAAVLTALVSLLAKA